MSNWQDSEYRIHLYAICSQHGIERIARRLGKTTSAIYKLLEGHSSPAPELFPAIYNITSDASVIEWFVSQCDGLSLTSNGHRQCDGDIRDEIESLTQRIGNVIERRRAAYADGRCTGMEKREIIAAAKEALEAAQTLYEDAKHVKVDD